MQNAILNIQHPSGKSTIDTLLSYRAQVKTTNTASVLWSSRGGIHFHTVSIMMPLLVNILPLGEQLDAALASGMGGVACDEPMPPLTTADDGRDGPAT